MTVPQLPETDSFEDALGNTVIIKRRKLRADRMDYVQHTPMTKAQWERCQELGGTKWIRAAVQAAPSRQFLTDEVHRLQDLVQRQGSELLGYRRIAEMKKEWERREYARVFGSEDRPAEHPAYGSVEWRAEHDAERKRSQDEWE